MLESTTFQVCMAMLIMANSAAIGIETDKPDLLAWDAIENLFLLIFTLEMLFKWSAIGVRRFFDVYNPDIGWNAFDFVVVTLGMVDFVAGLILGAGGNSCATLFRIIRLLRIMRIFRIVRFLKQLYLLAFGLAEALQAVFWVTLLMTFVLYVCAIVLVRTVGTPDGDDPHHDFLKMRFGAIPRSMLTLFELMASPNLPEYQQQGGLLWRRPLMTLFLIGFVIFGSFGMTALLTGVISESMFEKNQLRMDEDRVEREVLHKALVHGCERLFERLDTNPSGEVATEIVIHKLIPDIKIMFEEKGVDFSEFELERIVKLMDSDNSGLIGKDEFTHAILSIGDGLRAVSIHEIYYAVSVTKAKIEEMERSNEDATERIAQAAAKAATEAMREFLQERYGFNGSTIDVSHPPCCAEASSSICSSSFGGRVSKAPAKTRALSADKPSLLEKSRSDQKSSPSSQSDREIFQIGVSSVTPKAQSDLRLVQTGNEFEGPAAATFQRLTDQQNLISSGLMTDQQNLTFLETAMKPLQELHVQVLDMGDRLRASPQLQLASASNGTAERAKASNGTVESASHGTPWADSYKKLPDSPDIEKATPTTWHQDPSVILSSLSGAGSQLQDLGVGISNGGGWCIRPQRTRVESASTADSSSLT